MLHPLCTWSQAYDQERLTQVDAQETGSPRGRTASSTYPDELEGAQACVQHCLGSRRPNAAAAWGLCAPSRSTRPVPNSSHSKRPGLQAHVSSELLCKGDLTQTGSQGPSHRVVAMPAAIVPTGPWARSDPHRPLQIKHRGMPSSSKDASSSCSQPAAKGLGRALAE